MTSAIATLPAGDTESLATQFICVPLSVFRIQQSISVNLYCKPEGSTHPVLYRSPSIPLTAGDIEDLKKRGQRALYVANADFNAFGQNLSESLQAALGDNEIPAEEKFSFLQSATAAEVTAAFHAIKCDGAVSLAHSLSKQISHLLAQSTIVPRKLFAMVRHDFYTFTHVTNVASFAALLAERLGFADPVEREQITAGALLHDIGKRFIPATLLMKKGSLSATEWKTIRQHPQRGYEDLCEREDLSEGQLMMVYSHHERVDGRGYPVGLQGHEIHPWARLLAVVDVFDAITSPRPYRTPMKLSEALEYLQRHAGTHFESEMTKCWVSAMQQT